MEQIKTDASLWGWKSKTALVHPFDLVADKNGLPGYIFRTGTPAGSSIRPIPDYIKALVYYTTSSNRREETGYDLPVPDHLAIGTKSLKGSSETIFVEYREKPGVPTDCIMFTLDTGELKGCRIHTKSIETESFRLQNPITGEKDGTAVFLAVLVRALSHPEMSKTLLDCISQIEGIRDIIAPPGSIDKIYRGYLLTACAELYDACCISKDLNLQWPDSGRAIPKITKKDISKGIACPSPEKVLLGEFETLIPTDEGESIVFQPEKYKGKLFPGRVYTEAEKRLIPSLPSDFFVTKQLIDILDSVLETKDDFKAAKITQILLEGSAGSGKSASARAICAIFGLPMEVYTCGDRDTKEEMVQVIMPDVSSSDIKEISEKEKKLLETFTREQDTGDFDESLRLLGLPTYEECRLDAAVAFEEITGNFDESVDTSDVYRLAVDKALSSVKSLIRKIPSSQGVKYKSIKSAIIRAIEHGHCLVFEEVGNLRDAGALSFFNDVFDKEGTGIINTMYGDIKRHPDFMMIGTTNRPEDPGVHVMNPAFRSRFQYFATFDDLSTETLMGIVEKKCEITDPDLLRSIVEVYQRAEQAGRDVGAHAYLTMRSLYPFAMAIKRGKDPQKSFCHYILNAITTVQDQMDDIESSISDCALFQ